MEAQSFKDLIIQTMNSIERCIDERALHEQEIHKSGFLSDKGNAKGSENDYSKTRNDQSSEKQSSTSDNESSMLGNEYNERSNYGDDTDIRPSYDTESMVEVPYTAEYNV
nr:hypothetical protein [Tanacetum cinerariifolium]